MNMPALQPVIDSDQNAIYAGAASIDGKPPHDRPQFLLLDKANRHGLIAGATGTGKTVSLQILAEGFSEAGTPVFLADMKGEMGGMARPGSADLANHDPFARRSEQIGFDLDYRRFPVTFWDIWGEKGHPLRTTPEKMGPLLLSRILGLSEAQEGVLNIAFRVAADRGLTICDMDDLSAMLVHVGAEAKTLALQYGNISTASVGAIQRRLLVLEGEGGPHMFGEPALALEDLLRRDADGRGMVNVLNAERLMQSPRLYATFLLWLLTALFEELPEVGDPERPTLAFFFDEAHLLFRDAPPALVSKIEQMARLIRSKGVSLWFVTQNPADLPDSVLGQLGNRIQHALRAFTPKDAKALRDAASNYHTNPAFDTAETIKDVGTGEAVTSFLTAKGMPGMAERTLIRPPVSRLGPLPAAELAALIAASPMEARYRNRETHEPMAAMLAQQTAAPTADSQPRNPGSGHRYQPGGPAAGKPAPTASKTSRSSRSDSVLETFGKSFARQLGTQTGRALKRGIGGFFNKR